ncbi:hypothetical protein B0J11DRAFT_508351 [Dendryphion nanum]|uniref:Uncharacterized protein n=1 Tax=Dendryphion nanum TaxID=256645 RepID=A0A9P9DHV5_9PLEO|nr:hypothetical protein B0J11DRAFT_508351 [Dendryphion nanum]
MSQSTISAPVSVYQWNPVEVLRLNLIPNGQFTCSGVKNDLTRPCGWRLAEETTSINNLLNAMSESSPQDAFQFLDALAQSTLCHSHKYQKGHKTTEWARVLHQIPFIQARPNMAELSDSSTQEIAPPSILPLIPGMNDSPECLTSHIQTTRGEKDNAGMQLNSMRLEKQLHKLEEKVALHTKQIFILESSHKEATNTPCSPKTFTWSWACIKLRLQKLFRK